MLKAIIFDVDGVLANDTRIIVDLYEAVAKRLGLSTVGLADKVKDGLGLPAREIIKDVFGNKEEYVKAYQEILPKFLSQIKLMPGIKKMLEDISLKKGILTGGGRAILEKKLAGYLDYFDVIITNEDVVKYKPDPSLLLLACQKLKVVPAEAIYVGDARRDYEMARDAGIQFIGFVSGDLTKKDFQKLGVKRVTDSLLDLVNLVK